MRACGLLAALFLIAGLDRAAAADPASLPPILRGSTVEEVSSPSYARWDGFYVGGHVSYLSGGADFSNATQPLVSYILRNTTVDNVLGVSSWNQLGKQDSSGNGFGVFFGYNTQWDDVVLGLDVTYVKASLNMASSDSMSRWAISNGIRYDATVDASASFSLKDYASLRARAGYVMNHFLPYLTGGFVVGRADIFKSATVTETERDTNNGNALVGSIGPITATDAGTKFVYGYSAGAGIDVALMPNVFARAEYEYVQFFGLGGLKPYISTARAGLAARF
jgi:outer membrane immunogenic protein